jgi:hypothetical protein
MPTQETRHQLRCSFDKAFLKTLADENEITFIESTGKTFGIEVCMKRLYDYRKDRLERDRKVLFPSSTPRPQEKPNIVVSPSTYSAGDVLGEGSG